MKRVSPLTYAVRVGEQITVRIIQSTGLAHLVNYSIGGAPNPGTVPKGDPCTFSIEQSVLLGEGVFFTDAAGGSYTSQVAGEPGGDPPDHVSYERAGTEAFHVMIYTFLTQSEFASLGPDESTHSNIMTLSNAAAAPTESNPTKSKRSVGKAEKPKDDKPKASRGGQRK